MATRNNFKDFSEQDFMNDPFFQDWILYPTEERERYWQNFLAAHPEKKETAEKARTLLKAIAFKESWPTNEKVERSLTEALNTINHNGTKAPVYSMRSQLKPLYKWIAAAVLVFVVGGLWFIVGDRVRKPSVAVSSKPVEQDIMAPKWYWIQQTMEPLPNRGMLQ
jgi:transmembrane sensor